MILERPRAAWRANAQAAATTRAAVSSGLLLILVLTAAILFRVPAMLNARALNSDGAIVGLQALHMLDGEWSRFLWGAGYQASFDALLAALAFKVAGASPWTLMAVPLLGYLLQLWLAFAVLRRRLGAALALLGALVLIFTPRAVNSVTLYPPRQWCITCVFAAIWLLDGAFERRRPALHLAAGAMMGILALYLDLFALQFLAGLGLFALACSLDGAGRPAAVLRRLGALGAGAALGLALVWLLRRSPETTAHTASLSLARLPENYELLWRTCLPWLLGYKVFTQRDVMWQAPQLFEAVQLAGAVLLALGILYGGLAIFVRRLPWPVRRLGLLGCAVAGSSLAGFLISSMPVDQYSARYLAPIIWTAPFALAPVAYLLRPRRFGLALAPYLAAAVVGGWLSFGPFVEGPLPVLSPRGAAHDEARIGAALRERGVQYAAADYWQAYRLTFLWHERPVVVPLNAWQDRYAPYRRGFEVAPVVAYIFAPTEPEVRPEPYAAGLRQAGIPFEWLEVGEFTALIAHRDGRSVSWRIHDAGVPLPD
jgi:hypothetical protein